MKHVETLEALRTRLASVMPTTWTLRAANWSDPTTPEPAVDEQFVEEQPFGQATVDAGVGLTRDRRTTGTYQVMVCAPVGTGLLAINTLLDLLDGAFANTTLSMDDGTTILIVDIFVGEPRRADGDAWVRVPFVVTYEFTAQ